MPSVQRGSVANLAAGTAYVSTTRTARGDGLVASVQVVRGRRLQSTSLTPRWRRSRRFACCRTVRIGAANRRHHQHRLGHSRGHKARQIGYADERT